MLKSLESAINALSGMYKGFSEKKDYGRRGFLKAGAAIGTGVLAACCDSGGGSGGGGDDDPTPNPGDTTAPAKIDDLFATSSNNYGETVVLAWTSSGDDGHVGSPDHFIIAYSNNPIVTDADWDNATLAASLQASGPAGTQYAEEFEVASGDLYFAIKAVDEAGNQSNISNSPTAYIPSKAEFYVDKWLPTTSIYLTYAESVAVIQGEAGVNPSYALDLAIEMDKCDPPYPGTANDLANNLLLYTNGVHNPGVGDGELHDGFDPFYLDNDNIGDPGVRLYFAPDGNSVNDFSNLPTQAMQNLHAIIRDFLIAHVEAHPENYGNLDPSVDPTWNAG